MDIKVNNPSEIIVYGNTKSVSDYHELKKVITDLMSIEHNALTITMPDSFTITSSIIGYFLKLVYQDGVKLTLCVQDDRLITLLSDLRLTEAFNVIQITS